jgi:hypothetical protein
MLAYSKVFDGKAVHNLATEFLGLQKVSNKKLELTSQGLLESGDITRAVGRIIKSTLATNSVMCVGG